MSGLPTSLIPPLRLSPDLWSSFRKPLHRKVVRNFYSLSGGPSPPPSREDCFLQDVPRSVPGLVVPLQVRRCWTPHVSHLPSDYPLQVDPESRIPRPYGTPLRPCNCPSWILVDDTRSVTVIVRCELWKTFECWWETSYLTARRVKYPLLCPCLTRVCEEGSVCRAFTTLSLKGDVRDSSSVSSPYKGSLLRPLSWT